MCCDNILIFIFKELDIWLPFGIMVIVNTQVNFDYEAKSTALEFVLCVVYTLHSLYLVLLLYNGLKWWDLKYTKNIWVVEKFWFIYYIHRIGNR